MSCETECCGFGGTFAVRYDDVSGAVLSRKLDGAKLSGAGLVVLGDAGCMMQIDGGARRRGDAFKVQHLAELLASALPKDKAKDKAKDKE
jgi:L-lactate dehydrogenase complex protein LldE